MTVLTYIWQSSWTLLSSGSPSISAVPAIHGCHLQICIALANNKGCMFVAIKQSTTSVRSTCLDCLFSRWFLNLFCPKFPSRFPQACSSSNVDSLPLLNTESINLGDTHDNNFGDSTLTMSVSCKLDELCVQYKPLQGHRMSGNCVHDEFYSCIQQRQCQSWPPPWLFV